MVIGTVKIITVSVSSSSPHMIVAVNDDRNLPRIGGSQPGIVKGRVVGIVAIAMAADLVGGKGSALR
jgi:hypothetical protein